MNFLRDDEVPAPPTVQSHQETKWSGLVVGLGLTAAAVAMAVWSILSGAWESPWLIALVLVSALITLLVGRFALRTFFASRQPDNWRLRWNSDGLYLRYRSYLNNRFPADTPTVLYLAPREVRWLKARKDVLDTPDDRGTWGLSRAHRWLEIGLGNVDVGAIREVLSVEAKLRTPKGWRVNDFPLSVTPDGTLRLQLSRPDVAARLLRLNYSIRFPEEGRSADFNRMSRADQEDHVLALAAAGDTFAAIKAARQVYGFSLTDAKAFVEELRGRTDPPGD